MRTPPIAAAACAVAGLASSALAWSAPPPARQAAARADRLSPCAAHARQVASPARAAIGHRIALTLSASVRCADEALPLHVVLVLETSRRLRGADGQRMLQAASDAVTGLELGSRTDTLVGIVSFTDEAQVVADLTRDEAAVRQALAALLFGGDAAPERGVTVALEALRRARAATGLARGAVHEAIVLMCDGPPDGSCAPVQQAAAAAKNEGVLVITLCNTGACANACLASVASGARYQLKSDQSEAVVSRLVERRRQTVRARPSAITVRDTLPPAVRYLPASAQPRPSSQSADGATLVWAFNRVPSHGVTVTLLVVAMEAGHHRTSVAARSAFTDSFGRSAEFEFPAATVDVRPDPTATAPPPTTVPTATPAVIYVPQAAARAP